ncbi:MAG: endonuclease V [Bacteroidia bacterium]|nr:endonuclease V [Bacteroidia bacterium]
MILATDVYYYEKSAKAVGMLLEWEGSEEIEILVAEIPGVEFGEYAPGEFYKRELPCLLELLKQVDLKAIDGIVVDGHIYAGGPDKPGLGARLYEALGEKIPVIGVAKSSFRGNGETVVEVFRGKSKNPLYVSALGIPKERAAAWIQNMKGEHRMPVLLKKLDGLTRGNII